MKNKKRNYQFKFLYRETEGSELKPEYIFFTSLDPDMKNACEIEMLKYLTKHNYFSGKIEKMLETA